MSGPVLAFVETTDGAPSRGSAQALTAARALAEGLGTEVEAVAIGEAAIVAARFASRVHRLPEPDRDGADARVRLLHGVLGATGAAALVTAGTRSGLAIAPRVAVRSQGAYLEEATRLSVEDGAVVGERLTQLQRVTERIRAEASPVVVTVKAGAFDEAAPGDADGEVVDLDPGGDASMDGRVETRPHQGGTGAAAALDEADVVVAGGRGLGSAEAFAERVVPLAERLGAAIGATRAVVDAGWRPYGEQIGQTGRTVAPTVYLALGVSGAVQHLSGMNRSRFIVAVDTDPDAPIFEHCDVGVVADVHEVVPKLLEELEAN